MSLLPDVALGCLVPSILLLPPGVVSLVAAEEALELADAYPARGLLDESQRTTIRAAMGTRADGTWAASTVGSFMPRQNGKGDEIQCREQYGLTQLGEQIIHTAHEVNTAKEAHLRLVEWFEAWDDLRKLVRRITYANGDQAVELLNGGWVKYRTRTSGGGRGLDRVGTVIYDEAQHARPAHVAASSPTMAVHPNPQAWFAGSAGFEFSEVAWALRRSAVSSSPDLRMAYVEHTAQRVSIDDQGLLVLVNPDASDRRMWVIANPAYGRRISDDFLSSQLVRLGAELFSQEHLGAWAPLPADTNAKPVKLPADRWALTGVAAEVAASLNGVPAAAAFDVSLDGGWSSLAVACGGLLAPYVELVEHRSGTGWLPGVVVSLLSAHPHLSIGCNGAGPAGGQVGPVLAAMADAGIGGDRLVQFNATAYKQACSGFFTDVTELVDGRPRLRRPVSGQGPLDNAAADAAERPLVDSWVWDLRNVTVPISPLVAVTIARALLPAFVAADLRIW